MTLTLRPETPADALDIAALVAEAFREAPHTRRTEQFIVGALRDAGALTLSLVAEEAGVVVGHVALSSVTLSDNTPGWYGLGPVSVIPGCQGQGIGSRLINEALAQLCGLGAEGCVLVGDPHYYGRFGFRALPSLVLPRVPPEYFLALAFQGDVPEASVTFHPGFEATG